MKELQDTKQQIELAEIVTSLYRRGCLDLAADIILLTSSYDGTHVLFDDTNRDSTFMRTLHELLDDLGFDSIMKVSKEKAEKLGDMLPKFNTQYPGHISPVKPWDR